MENLIDTARRYGEIADQMFDRWSIPAATWCLATRPTLPG